MFLLFIKISSLASLTPKGVFSPTPARGGGEKFVPPKNKSFPGQNVPGPPQKKAPLSKKSRPAKIARGGFFHVLRPPPPRVFFFFKIPWGGKFPPKFKPNPGAPQKNPTPSKLLTPPPPFFFRAPLKKKNKKKKRKKKLQNTKKKIIGKTKNFFA